VTRWKERKGQGREKGGGRRRGRGGDEGRKEEGIEGVGGVERLKKERRWGLTGKLTPRSKKETGRV